MVVGYYDQKGIPDQVRSIIHFLPCFQMRVASGGGAYLSQGGGRVHPGQTALRASQTV